MEPFGVFFAAIIPALAVLAYVEIKAKADWRSESLWNGFLMGAVAGLGLMGGWAILHVTRSLPVEHVTSIFRQGMSLAGAKAFFVAAVPEEATKFVMLVWIAERHVDVRRKQDILPLAVAVSLGFAALENLVYVSQAENWRGVAALRSVTAVPGHGVNGLIMGALVTFARLAPHRQRQLLFAALALPILTHAAYDFPLMAMEAAASDRWLFFGWTAILVLSGVLAAGLSSRALMSAARVDAAASVEPPAAYGYGVVAISLAMMASGGASAVFSVHIAQLPWQALWAVIPSNILPVMFGVDLLIWYRRTQVLARPQEVLPRC